MRRIACLSLAAALAIASITRAAPPDVPAEISRAMQDRDYEAAIQAIDKRLQADDASKDYLTFLKGRAYHFLERYEEAVRVFDSFEKAFPDSPWTRRVRFAKALSLVRNDDFRRAEAIYRQESEYLLSNDRKEQVADIYLEFALAYFKPADRDKKPDYQKALELFQKTLEAGPKPQKRVEVELRIGECCQNLDKLDEAIGQFSRIVERKGEQALDVEARYRIGECELKRGRHVEARRAWQDLLAEHGDAESERIAEATYQLAHTYRVPAPPSREDLNLGVAALKAFIAKYPDHTLASRAHLEIALSCQKHGRYEDAAEALKEYLAEKRYEEREETPTARFLLGECYQLQKKFAEALATWRDYLAKHPAHRQWSDAQRKIIDTDYLVGLERQTAKEYDEARKLWSAFLTKYPLDGRAAQILYSLGQMSFDQKKWDQAISDWRRLVSKYPKTDPASAGQFMIARTLEEKLGKFEHAIEEYKKVTWGSHQGQARSRIARLTAKQMAIRTEQVFRTSQAPRIKLTTRNIEKVSVRAYKIDLETYFRKMHLAVGVESLDTALIDPDETFEFQTPGYAKYKELESDIALPMLKADSRNDGRVLVVTVSSDTLEATTMVLQSDLDIIVKSSRDEVFVFTENMRTGKPWPGVRLLLSNGGKVFAEARTGDDGVFQHSYDELKSADDVRVFAVVDNHTASNIVGLNGLGAARGLASKGYLYTDRSAYRPGQMVNVRGVVRRVADDTYQIEKGKQYTLRIYDTRNRFVYQQDVRLNEFGSFHSHFVLPPASPQGSYRILLTDDDTQQYQGSFTVRQYKLESVQLLVESERLVYYRGEEIEGVISAKYYYGAPLVGREVRYRLADGRIQIVKTDDKGEAKFKLSTRDYRETQVLPLVAELPEYNLSATRRFVLAAQEYSLSLSTLRPCYLSGEPFEVTVKAIDAEGEPTAQPLVLSVLERTDVDGRTGERLVEKKEIQTGKDNGEAKVALTLKKGARYILRAEGVDRFENPITGQHAVQISGEDDDVRLRILAGKHTYRVGDAPRINVHWREAPALAVATFQGAKVLGYRLIVLETGVNKLDVPMTADLAPNFELAIAVMTDDAPISKEAGKRGRRFHSASSPFTVQRDLVVKVAPVTAGGRNVVPPGEPIEVKVTATDPQGKPVDAEVSVAMVEQAILDRFAPNVASISDFFRGELRQTAVRTSSSITFHYAPKTKRIDPRLLAEAERLVVEEEERERLRELAAELPMETDVVGRAAGAAAKPSRPAPEAAGLPAASPAAPPPGRDRAELPGQQPAGDRLIAGFAYRAYGGRPSAGQADSAQQASEDRVPVQVEFDAFAGKELFAGDRLHVIHAGRSDVSQLESLLGTLSWQSQANGVTAVMRNGAVVRYNLADLQGERGESLLNDLKAADALLLPGLPSRETGYWNPAIRTGAKGTATVRFIMPEGSTAWRLLAKGVTADTLAGEGDERLVAEKDLFGELKLPLAFTDGDRASILATIHNSSSADGEITVTLKTAIGGKTSEQTKTLDAKKGVQQQIVFETQLERPDNSGDRDQVHVALELIVAAGDREDRVQRTAPLEPYGMPIFGTASGAASSDTTAWVELPGEMPTASPSLQIAIGPTIERGLLDVLFGPALRCQIVSNRFAASSDAAASDLMAAVALQELFGKTLSADNPQAAAIDQRIRSSIGLLVSAQQDDGGWSWAGRQGESDRFVSARMVWALALAAKLGYAIPEDAKDKGIAFLRGQIAKTANADYESKSILLHALAAAGQDDFPLANRLYRNRAAISTAALLHLAMAFGEMERGPMAEDVLKLVAQRNLDEGPPHRKSELGCLPWSHSPAELRALYSLALQQVRPADPAVSPHVDWLVAHRVGNRWSPDKVTGPAMLAVCRWFARSKYENEHYKLAVHVNDHRVAEFEFAKDSGTETVHVPAELLQKGKQRVNFRLTGRGRFSYQCVMEGFVSADQVKSTTDDWRIERFYEAAPLERDGKVVPRGFDVLRGTYSAFRNPLTQLPVGRRGQVTLRVWRQGIASDTPPEQLEYLVITEPLPSGVTVIEDSVKGGFEWFEVSPGAITFYVGNRRSISTVSYDIHGFLPGRFRAAPPVIRDAYRPDRFASDEAKLLEVLPLGAKSSDPYRLTPRELYELGKRRYHRKEMEKAAEYLTELVTKWSLEDGILKDATLMLLDAHLEIGPPSQVVHHFEVVKERWPEMEIPYEKILKIGAAYHDMGEYERAFLVFRATVESSFLAESRAAGFLQAQDELLRSIETMSSLLREYPPESYVAAATFDLAQQVYAAAPQAKTNKRLRDAKITRVDLVRRACGMLDGFLTAYPEDPGADQAAFSMATALLELEQHKPAIEACRRFIRRYPNSQDIDSFWYTVGYCHFASGEHEEALEVCRKVSEMTRKDAETGRVTEASNRYRAIYILGQVYHSLGDAAKAIQEYSRVEDRFADAKEAIQYFTRRDIRLPEATTVAPGKPAEAELEFRNVASCEVRVYRIDLMKFSLLHRNLSGITNINLAGIHPFYESTIKLGDGKDYCDRKYTLQLPLKNEGAYLVVCRGGDLHTSGLVLITPLKIDVQEEETSGRVRTTVRDTTKDAYVSNAHVKVIGSENQDFFSGATDLRGIFVADGVRGRSTVIAQADSGRYAFHRGATRLGPAPEVQQQPAAARAVDTKQPVSNELLKGLYLRNTAIQGQNLERQKGQYFNTKGGVTVEAVK